MSLKNLKRLHLLSRRSAEGLLKETLFGKRTGHSAQRPDESDSKETDQTRRPPCACSPRIGKTHKRLGGDAPRSAILKADSPLRYRLARLLCERKADQSRR
jgi:hypothetical protein